MEGPIRELICAASGIVVVGFVLAKVFMRKMEVGSTDVIPTKTSRDEPLTITGRNRGTIRRTIMQELEGLTVD